MSNIFTFQNAVTEAGNGNVFTPEFADVISIEFSGTASSFTAVFEELGESGAWHAIAGIRRSDFAPGSSVTAKTGRWDVTLSGVLSLRVRVSAVSGGNLTVKGKLVIENA